MSAVVSGPVAEFDAQPGMMAASGGLIRAVSEATIRGLQAAICLMQDLSDRRRNAGTDRALKRGLVQPDHKPCLLEDEGASISNGEQRP